MGREIERKFLVRGDEWRAAGDGGERMLQGYLVAERDRSVRVRLRPGRAGGPDGAVLTIKGATRGATRSEFEYPIPFEEAEQMLEELAVGHVIDKTRHRVRYAGHTWEVDEFHGASEGLVVAEIELASESERFEKPDWLGEEVTDDPRYYNANLVRDPLPSRRA